jgi:hypothetical protein
MILLISISPSMLVSFRLVTEPGCGRGAGLLIRLA